MAKTKNGEKKNPTPDTDPIPLPLKCICGGQTAGTEDNRTCMECGREYSHSPTGGLINTPKCATIPSEWKSHPLPAEPETLEEIEAEEEITEELEETAATENDEQVESEDTTPAAQPTEEKPKKERKTRAKNAPKEAADTGTKPPKYKPRSEYTPDEEKWQANMDRRGATMRAARIAKLAAQKAEKDNGEQETTGTAEAG